MLFEDAPPATIVDAPASLVNVGPLDGLDARSAWPPLLRPGVLMDLASYDVWERYGVELLTREGVTPETALASLDLAAARIAAWTPGDGTLLQRVHDVFATTAPAPSVLASDDMAIKRWLAARLFACWVAYQKDGLSAIVHYLRSCFDRFVIERACDDNALEAIRRTDLRVMHT